MIHAMPRGARARVINDMENTRNLDANLIPLRSIKYAINEMIGTIRKIKDMTAFPCMINTAPNITAAREWIARNIHPGTRFRPNFPAIHPPVSTIIIAKKRPPIRIAIKYIM
jgi:hypothetical protein